MNNVWFRELGFNNNPFSIKPAAFHDQVVGFEKVVDEISYGVLNNKVVVVEGDYGNGKSSILKRLLNDFGGKKQVVIPMYHPAAALRNGAIMNAIKGDFEAIKLAIGDNLVAEEVEERTQSSQLSLI